MLKSSTPPPANPHLSSVAVLIPVWQPGDPLLHLVSTLARAGFGAIVVVDDGNPHACTTLFAELAALPRVHILRHALNRGKGRALKSGIRYILREMDGIQSLITADADGQHLPEDILRVAHATWRADDRPVLGARRFSGSIPLRSQVGNLCTRYLFQVLTGHRLQDTQTGLRGLPRDLWPALIGIAGERYEYETAMLAELVRHGVHPVEVPIATVYHRGKHQSHFRPLKDSALIYRMLLRLWKPNRPSLFAEPGILQPQQEPR